MRYPLLLMELLNSTPEAHPDKVPLASAVLAVKEINVNINEYKRRKDLGEKDAVVVKEVPWLPGLPSGPLFPKRVDSWELDKAGVGRKEQ